MTEYTATCDYESADTVQAYGSGGAVWLNARQDGGEASVKLYPTNARAFARGILALADEIDGGEANPIKVGDQVRVTDAAGNPDFVGKTGFVKRLNSSVLPYRVEFGDGRGNHGDINGWWNCLTVVRVEEPESAAAPAPIQAGDVVTIVRE